jgi:hypothetical protein
VLMGDAGNTCPMTDLTIRSARTADEPRLRRIAALDSANLPHGDLLVGVVGGEIQAAIEAGSGRVIANPFVRTAELVELLVAADRPVTAPPDAKYARRHGGLRLA